MPAQAPLVLSASSDLRGDLHVGLHIVDRAHAVDGLRALAKQRVGADGVLPHLLQRERSTAASARR